MILRLAWRNIWRNKRRTLLTLSAIVFSTAILSFFLSLQFSSYETSIDASVSLLTGDLQVQEARFKDDPSFRAAIDDPASLLQKLESQTGIQHAALRAETGVMLNAGSRTVAGLLLGVQAAAEIRISRIPELIHEGSYTLAPHSYTMVLGTLMAKNLSVTVGDEVVMLGQGYDGSSAAALFTVEGIVETGVQEMDRSLLFVPLTSFQEMSYAGDRVHRIVLRKRAGRDTAVLQQQLLDLLESEGRDNLAVWRWDELLPGLKESMDLDLASSWIFYMGLIAVVSLTVMNTLLMAILERKKEFGLLGTLGMNARTIVRLLCTECVLLVGLGVTIGILLAIAVTSYYGVYGFRIPGVEEIVKQWNIPAVVYTSVTLQSLLLAPAVLLTSILLALIIPCYMVFKWRPLEALRGD